MTRFLPNKSIESVSAISCKTILAFSTVYGSCRTCHESRLLLPGLYALTVSTAYGVTPSVVNQEFHVLAEKFEKRVLVCQRASSYISHREHTVFLELFRVTPANAPELRERRMAPALFSVAALIQVGYAHAVGVGRDALGDDIHGDLFGKLLQKVASVLVLAQCIPRLNQMRHLERDKAYVRLHRPAVYSVV